MQHRHLQNSTENQSNLIQRILNSLRLMLLSRLFRLVGWCAVVGLPTMVRMPRRFAGLARGYPIATSTICLALLICVAVWNESNHPGPAEFEIESIDNIDEPDELIAMSHSLLPETTKSRPAEFAGAVRSNAAVATQHSARRTP